MPNWYSNCVVVKGPAKDLTAFKARHIHPGPFHDENNFHLDFETVTPMPEALKAIRSNTTCPNLEPLCEFGLVVLGRDDLLREREQQRRGALLSGWRSKAEQMLDHSEVKGAGVTTVAELREWLKRKYPNCVEVAKRHIWVHEATGYLDSRVWEIVNWGVQYSCRLTFTRIMPEEIEFYFQTPWKPPEPVLRRLRELWTSLAFTFRGCDEFDDIYSETGAPLQ
jgi:hypothetical protein